MSDPETAEALYASDATAFWEFVVANLRGKHKIVGAKIFLKHKRNDPLWDYIFGGDPRVIHLWRASVFDTYISSLRSQASGQWQLKKDQEPAPETASQEIRFDPQKYLHYRDMARRNYIKICERLKDNPKALSVEYSEITKPETLSARFTEYFGVPVTLEATLQKVTRRPAIEYLENPSDAELYVDDRLDERSA